MIFKFRHKLGRIGAGAATAALTYALASYGAGLDRASEKSVDRAGETVSRQTKPASASRSSTSPKGSHIGAYTLPSETSRIGVCNALREYPKAASSKLSFHSNVISDICRPFVKYQRSDLDRCGDQKTDPYLSKFTWPSRLEMSRRGKANVYTDAAFQPQLAQLLSRASELRDQATDLCCAPGDSKCRDGMARVEFNVCKPVDDPTQPDPCVFGGTYRMPGSGYDSIFRAIARQRGEGVASELRAIALKNLGGRALASMDAGPTSGSITLTSYVSTETGSQSMEPVILHELGHACSMVKMQNASVDGTSGEAMKKALRAAEWLDSAKKRCDPGFKIPEAVDDFWESVGESRELSSCLKDLAVANQKKLIDKPCNGLCPGHYLEESVGIAFSLLLGDLTGGPNAVFPNTCDHVRDGQHPMVSDVAECLLQASPRFRARIGEAYGCETRLASTKVTKTSL